MEIIRKPSRKLIFLLCLLLIIPAGCSQKKEETKKIPDIPVTTTAVTEGSLTGNSEFSGKLKAGTDLSISPKGTGPLTVVNVKKGDKVTEGQVLAKLDDASVQLALKQEQAAQKRADSAYSRAKNAYNRALSTRQQAEASIRQAQGNLAQAQSARKNAIENATFAVDNAQVQYNDAKKNRERMEALAQGGAASQKQYEDALNVERRADIALQQANANVRQASGDDNIRALQASVDQASISMGQANNTVDEALIGMNEAQTGIEQAKMSVEQAKQRVEDTLVRAPASGQISEVNIKQGEVANGQKPFARLVSLDNMKVETLITPEKLPLFQVGQTLDVDIASTKKAVNGTVSFVAAASEESNLFKVEVQIPNDKHKLRPGMVAKVLVPQTLTDKNLIVPSEAVVEKQGQSYVYIIKDKKAVEKKVKVVQMETDQAAVKGSLKDGDQVVIKGQTLLKNGSKVKVIKEEK